MGKGGSKCRGCPRDAGGGRQRPGAVGTSQSYVVLDWEGDTLYFVSSHVGCCVGRCRALSRWGKEAADVGMDQEMQEEVIRDRGQQEPV